MCSYFPKRMENYQGDLTDIVRASGGEGPPPPPPPPPVAVGGESWHQFAADHPMNYPSGMMEEMSDDFGDPFSNMRDPLLLHQLDNNSTFYGGNNNNNNNNNNSIDLRNTRIADTISGPAGGEDIIKRPLNIFSRMLQISPNINKLPIDPPSGIKSIINPPILPLVSNDHHMNMNISGNTSKGCLLENPGVQISSPRNNTGIKRRKSQAKKVVCIPAPAPANSRPTGEVVPSDLWAWRKYGQKPIKGSPYPRGYYRCSSSKGCSARKQVERSRTDPNMLVITYTSEHNHPWPTQRNALAGSTRSQPTKNTISGSKNSPNSQKGTSFKEEQKESNNIANVSMSSTGPSSVKEEMEELDHEQVEMDGGDVRQFNEGFPQSYKPTLPDSNQSDDFFADLGELEGDPINLLFTQGFSEGDDRANNKALDPFSLFDWTGNNNSNNNNINNTSLGEGKRGL